MNSDDDASNDDGSGTVNTFVKNRRAERRGAACCRLRRFTGRNHESDALCDFLLLNSVIITTVTNLSPRQQFLLVRVGVVLFAGAVRLRSTHSSRAE